MLREELLKNCLGFFAVAHDDIDARQIQIRLVIRRRYANRFFEAANGFCSAPRTEIENPQVVQCFGISRPSCQRFLQVLVGMVRVVLLSIDRKSTRLNSSHGYISYAVFCLKKKKT